MKSLGLVQALVLTHKADKMTDGARCQLQQQRLRELVAYVRRSSPYFAQLYAGLADDAPLEALPPTGKAELMAHFDTWMTDRSITKEKVERFMADPANVGRKLDGKYLVYTTSGSTGRPCIVLYDDTAIHVASAIGVLRSFARKQDMAAFIRRGGRTLALFADEGFYLGCGSVKYTLRRMPWKRNKMRTCDVRKPAAEIVQVLNEFQPAMIGCYPTAMELLAAEQEAGRLHIRPALIMTGGERLDDTVRQHLAQAFGCAVQTNYSCTEGGTVACECTERHFHINDDWVIVEAVDEAGKPVPFGTQSAKVLLTNLANRICPIIRFEITDRVVLHQEPCACGSTRPWLTLEGRTDDILTFEAGVRVAPLPLYAILKEVRGVERFQLIQTDASRLELRLTAQEKPAAFAAAKQAVERYLAQNGVCAEVVLSDKAPEADPNSGKFKHIVARRAGAEEKAAAERKAGGKASSSVV